MFARLKKQVLEDGPPERLQFSPRKLPGGPVAVRSPPAAGDPLSLNFGGVGESETARVETKEGDGEKEKHKEDEKTESQPLQNINMHPTILPSHLKSSLTQEAVHQELLDRIQRQQLELDELGQRLQAVGREHEEEREKWREDAAVRLADKDSELQALQNRFDKVDEHATELKLQVVELQLEKIDCEQSLEGEVTALKERLSELEREKGEGEKTWSEQKKELDSRVAELEEAVSDKEFQVSTFQEKVRELETYKAEALSGLVRESKDEVLLKLQNEIIDLERRLHAKTMDVEMARIDADTEMKWKEEQLQEGVARQLSLMATDKQLKKAVVEKNDELRELRQELDRERMEGGKRGREVERLTGELDMANTRVKQLEQKMEETESSHARHLQEMAAQRDVRVAELSKALEELRAEILGSETVTTLSDRNPLDFATVATQTDTPQMTPSMEKEEEESGNEAPAILQVGHADPYTSLTNGMGGSEEGGEQEGTANMQSHELLGELQLLRQEQLRLQEEVAEKNKLVRFQQLKIVDMRKALHKELRSQSSMEVTPPNPHAFPTPPTGHWSRGNGENSPLLPPGAGGRISSCDDVNIQYLKHVIIKFLCSREDEATQLIRAVSTLLDFTRQEEQFVKEYFNYKMSWFGSMPRPLYHPVKQS